MFTGTAFDITTNYVVPETPVLPGSYLDLPINRDLAVLTFDLESMETSCNRNYASLTEIEIYVNGTLPKERLDYKAVVVKCSESKMFLALEI
jgi:hypothetical protein